MERRKQILELVRRFDKDLDLSLDGLNQDDQLTILKFLKKVIPIFTDKQDGYYDLFYGLYESEILETLRNKARKLQNVTLTDYFAQESMKLVHVQHDLKIPARSADDQILSDEEYKNYMQKLSRILNLRYQILLTSSLPETKTPVSNSKVEIVKPKFHTEGEIDKDDAQPLGDREEYMSIAECAKFLGRSKVTIHEYKKQGLPCYRIGRTVKFKKSEVLNFMRQQEKRKPGK